MDAYMPDESVNENVMRRMSTLYEKYFQSTVDYSAKFMLLISFENISIYSALQMFIKHLL